MINIKKLLLYILCGILFLFIMNYFHNLYLIKKYRDGFDFSVPDTSGLSSSMPDTSGLSSSMPSTSSSFSTYAFLNPSTPETTITDATLDKVIIQMKRIVPEMANVNDTTGISKMIKENATEVEGVYYLKNNAFPLDPFVQNYINYMKGTEDYQKLDPRYKNNIDSTFTNTKRMPNKLIFYYLYSMSSGYLPKIKTILDEIPESSRILYSKTGYVLPNGDSYACEISRPSLIKHINQGTPDAKNLDIRDFSMLPTEIKGFEFIDKANPCNPCSFISIGNELPACKYSINGYIPPLFSALWGMSPATVESESNVSTTSFPSLDAATAKPNIVEEQTQGSEIQKKNAENEAAAKISTQEVKNAELDTEMKRVELENAQKSEWQKLFG